MRRSGATLSTRCDPPRTADRGSEPSSRLRLDGLPLGCSPRLVVLRRPLWGVHSTDRASSVGDPYAWTPSEGRRIRADLRGSGLQDLFRDPSCITRLETTWTEGRRGTPGVDGTAAFWRRPCWRRHRHAPRPCPLRAWQRSKPPCNDEPPRHRPSAPRFDRSRAARTATRSARAPSRLRSRSGNGSVGIACRTARRSR